ncbi:SDR family NAD(P)-dependent oxidoreductase [Dehalococcoidia bacterium]|nr:SDR family NAD(P)-dependent oxidoreductase [Dehalococcoidia bacterium]
MDLGITGKVALVTGGSRGLGKQSALSLAKEGCKVSLCARNIDELENVVSDLRKNGYDALGIEADVTTVQGIETFYEKSVNAFGQVDIVVNNVGGTIGGRDFDTTSDEDWINTINLNLMSAVRLTRWVVPDMKQRQWGRIVNIASIWGRESGGGMTYMAAKAALIAFSKHLGLSLAADNILVNSIAPGSIKFPGGGWDRFVNNNTEEVVENFIKNQLPMGKFGWPEPVGDTVAFLCSERADLITATSITVDGGQSRSLI